MTKSTKYTFEKSSVKDDWTPQFPYMPGINSDPIDRNFLK